MKQATTVGVRAGAVQRGFVGMALAFMVGGCGHRATRDECEEIFTLSAKLALQEEDVRDAEEIEKQVEQARVTKADTLVSECLGKRITNQAMTCARAAASPKALEACLE